MLPDTEQTLVVVETTVTVSSDVDVALIGTVDPSRVLGISRKEMVCSPFVNTRVFSEDDTSR